MSIFLHFLKINEGFELPTEEKYGDKTRKWGFKLQDYPENYFNIFNSSCLMGPTDVCPCLNNNYKHFKIIMAHTYSRLNISKYFFFKFDNKMVMCFISDKIKYS